MSVLPSEIVASLKDTVRGDIMGPVALTPPVDESISALGERTAKIGEKILLAHGAKVDGDNLVITIERPVTQEPELFKLSDFTKMWNPDWSLERAGFGGGNGGVGGIRGATYLDGDVLSIFPRDEVRGALLRRSVKLSDDPVLSFDAGADPGRTWHLAIYVNNDKVLEKLIIGPRAAQSREARTAMRAMEGGPLTELDALGRYWEHITLDLSAYKHQPVVIRLYDFILVPSHDAGNSYWRKLAIQ